MANIKSTPTISISVCPARVIWDTATELPVPLAPYAWDLPREGKTPVTLLLVMQTGLRAQLSHCGRKTHILVKDQTVHLFLLLTICGILWTCANKSALTNPPVDVI